MLILGLGLFLFESLYFLQENAMKYLCSLVRFLMNSGSEEGQTGYRVPVEEVMVSSCKRIAAATSP